MLALLSYYLAYHISLVNLIQPRGLLRSKLQSMHGAKFLKTKFK